MSHDARNDSQPIAAEYLQELDRRLDLVIEGAFDAVPDGDDPVFRKIKTLADRHSAQAMSALQRTVDISIVANRSVTGVAEMLRSILDVDGRASSIVNAVAVLVGAMGDIASNSQGAAERAQQVADRAQSGLSATKRAGETMDQIAEAVQQAADKVSDLSGASEQIGSIVNEIEAIAKQTNLLALNATIEAARAGEAGKGFAVVAGEVKSLATQTAKATEDIRGRIELLRSEMQQIVGSMNRGGEEVKNGLRVIADTGEEMGQVFDQVVEVNGMMHEIAGILTREEAVVQEISAGITQIAALSGENATAIEGVIETLEATEAPIVGSVNELASLGLPNATIHAAKSDHMIWMRKLAQMLAGRARLNPDELADHHSCRLGKWYDRQTDPALTGHPAWAQLEGPHAKVHAAGIEAARSYAADDLATAVAKVREAGDASVEVMALLDRMAADLATGSQVAERAA